MDNENYKSKPRNVGRNRVNEKPKDLKLAVKKLIKYLKKFMPLIIIALVLAILSSVFSIIGPNKLSDLTDEIAKGIMTGIDFEAITSIAVFLLTIYLISALFNYIQGFIMATVANNFAKSLRTQISQKINKLPLRYFDTHSFGDILSRVTNDVDTIGMTLHQSLGTLVSAITLFIGSIIMMFYTNWILAITGIVSSLLGFVFMFIILAKSQKYFNARQVELGNLNGHIEEIYSNHNVVRVYNGMDEASEKFDDLNNRVFVCNKKSQFLSGLMQPIMNFIGNIAYVGVAILGGYLAAKGRITVGNIQSFIQYMKQFTQPISQIAQISGMLQTMVASAERVFEFLEEKEEVEETENPKSTEGLVGNVTFDHVEFGYDEDKIIIHDFNAKVHDGQKIAIVGPTGAGKTTMVKLLMRFYDVNSGGIYVDGINIKDFNRGDLRKMFGMVLQDTWLFSGSIKDNIRYGKPDATDTEVIEAAKAAHVHHFIKTLPNSYEMILNEETSNISAGQKQLLTIARVILANPKILILDEATSSIDTRTEIQIQSAMDNLMKGRTSFIIAHRLSTIKNADLILVMEHGDIVEQGNHEELLAKNGAYARLYNSQFEEGEEE